MYSWLKTCQELVEQLSANWPRAAYCSIRKHHKNSPAQVIRTGIFDHATLHLHFTRCRFCFCSGLEWRYETAEVVFLILFLRALWPAPGGLNEVWVSSTPCHNTDGVKRKFEYSVVMIFVDKQEVNGTNPNTECIVALSAVDFLWSARKLFVLVKSGLCSGLRRCDHYYFKLSAAYEG